MKGEITYKVLEAIENGVEKGVDLFSAYLNAGYGASVGKINYELYRIKKKKEKTEEERKYVERYSRFIYSLKRDSLVVGKNGGGFDLTKKGREKLEELKERKENSETLPEIDYEKLKGDETVIVTFDIPENKKNKRKWLRSSLVFMGFEMIQRSVWLGKGKLPEKFIEDLKKAGLLEFVEIFSIKERGTLERFNS